MLRDLFRDLVLKQPLNVTCPKCGKKITQTFGQVEASREIDFACLSCKETFSLTTTDLQAALKCFLDQVDVLESETERFGRAESIARALAKKLG